VPYTNIKTAKQGNVPMNISVAFSVVCRVMDFD